MQPINNAYDLSVSQQETVRAPYKPQTIADELLVLRGANWSLRKIAKDRFGGLVTHGTIARLLAGTEPHDPEIRKILELPEVSMVIAIEGVIPPGTQALGASWCKDCGRPYESNHPRRRKCFTCSPFKKHINEGTIKIGECVT